MTLKFRKHDLPVAYSMVNAACRIKPRRDGHHSYEKYFLLWTAFDNIYTTIASRKGFKIELVMDENDEVETWTNGSVKIPLVTRVNEGERLSLALGEFDQELKQRLIHHESTAFFVNRVPFWEGAPVEFDAFGQRLNGVLNVNHTTSADYPVWSPIDTQVYQRYMANTSADYPVWSPIDTQVYQRYMAKPEAGEDQDFILKQIVELLQTVRKNLMQTSMKLDDANDISVINHALSLLELVVGSFIR
jgi:hypothetical protein